MLKPPPERKIPVSGTPVVPPTVVTLLGVQSAMDCRRDEEMKRASLRTRSREGRNEDMSVLSVI